MALPLFRGSEMLGMCSCDKPVSGQAKQAVQTSAALLCCTSAMLCSEQHAYLFCNATSPLTTPQALRRQHVPFPSRFLSWPTILRHRWATHPAATCQGMMENVQSQMFCPFPFNGLLKISQKLTWSCKDGTSSMSQILSAQL